MMGPASSALRATDADAAVRSLRDRLLKGDDVRHAEEFHPEPGTMEDYRRLSAFHYRGHHPGAVTKVWRLTCRAQTVIGRFVKRRTESAIAGVLVLSLPALSCALRNAATANRYCGLDRRGSAMLLNREVRTISRVVIDPRWRACGLAVKLVKNALAHPESGPYGRLRYTEALAVMGRVNPFFERAGMTRYERPPHPSDSRLLDTLASLDIPAHMLASPRMIESHLARCASTARLLLMRELHRWHRTSTRARSSDEGDFASLIRAARDRLLSQPVYYLHCHDRITDMQSQMDADEHG